MTTATESVHERMIQLRDPLMIPAALRECQRANRLRDYLRDFERFTAHPEMYLALADAWRAARLPMRWLCGTHQTLLERRWRGGIAWGLHAAQKDALDLLNTRQPFSEIMLLQLSAEPMVPTIPLPAMLCFLAQPRHERLVYLGAEHGEIVISATWSRERAMPFLFDTVERMFDHDHIKQDASLYDHVVGLRAVVTLLRHAYEHRKGKGKQLYDAKMRKDASEYFLRREAIYDQFPAKGAKWWSTPRSHAAARWLYTGVRRLFGPTVPMMTTGVLAAARQVCGRNTNSDKFLAETEEQRASVLRMLLAPRSADEDFWVSVAWAENTNLRAHALTLCAPAAPTP